MAFFYTTLTATTKTDYVMTQLVLANSQNLSCRKGDINLVMSCVLLQVRPFSHNFTQKNDATELNI
jgi:hypothetical protein